MYTVSNQRVDGNKCLNPLVTKVTFQPVYGFSTIKIYPKTIPLFLRKTNLPCCHGYCKVERSVVLACEWLAADLVIPKVGIHSLVPIPHPAVWCRNAWANFISLKQPMKFQTSIRIVNKYFSRSKSCY